MIQWLQIYQIWNNSTEYQLKNIHIWQDKDPAIKKIKKQTYSLDKVKNVRIIDKISYNNNLVLVPENLIDTLIIYIHALYGHFGVQKTLNILNEKFTFKKLRHRIDKLLEHVILVKNVSLITLEILLQCKILYRIFHKILFV